VKLELSEQTKVELKECYEKLRQELKVKVEERDILMSGIEDMQDCIDAINTLLRFSTIDIPDPQEKEDEYHLKRERQLAQFDPLEAKEA